MGPFQDFGGRDGDGRSSSWWKHSLRGTWLRVVCQHQASSWEMSALVPKWGHCNTHHSIHYTLSYYFFIKNSLIRNLMYIINYQAIENKRHGNMEQTDSTQRGVGKRVKVERRERD